MRPRYLLLAFEQGALGEAGRLAAATGLSCLFARPGLAAFGDGALRWLPVGDEGLVVGTLFRRHGPGRPLDALDAADREQLAQGAGRRLLCDYWGGYVAAFRQGGGVRVLRDPSGALPCYHARRSGLAAFASDAGLLVQAGLVRAAIDWPGVARHLAGAGVPSSRTGLEAVRELLPGFGIDDATAGDDQQPCWSPWDHAGASDVDRGAAAERLFRILLQCVGAWGATATRPLLSVSGGLDSSITAACLAAGGCRPAALTMYGDDANGDERAYARLLCGRFGLDLFERQYRLADIDITAPLAPHLPRPFGRVQALAYERAHLDLAGEIGADAFVTGNGGDSVFGYSQSAAPIADLYLAEGVSGRLWAAAKDVCRQTGCSFPQAAAAAVRIARGPRSYRCRPNRLFLSPQAAGGPGEGDLSHPWLAAPTDALPGKAAHVAAILRILHCLEPGRSAHLPVINPLVSQPVVEACLGVPSWEWRAGGRDRSLAREAFTGRIPAPILRRRVKGGPDAFAARTLDHFRSAIRARLLDGGLAGNGLLDRAAVEAALAGHRPVAGAERVRLLELTAAEAWLDSWSGAPGDLLVGP